VEATQQSTISWFFKVNSAYFQTGQANNVAYAGFDVLYNLLQQEILFYSQNLKKWWCFCCGFFLHRRFGTILLMIRYCRTIKTGSGLTYRYLSVMG
jgi:hypothetical protein